MPESAIFLTKLVTPPVRIFLLRVLFYDSERTNINNMRKYRERDGRQNLWVFFGYYPQNIWTNYRSEKIAE